MSGRTLTADTATSAQRSRLRWYVAAGLLALGGLLTAAAHAATPPAYAATASVAPQLYYLNDTVGSVYTFTVNNTGTTNSIGAVEITRPSGWTVTSCPSGPTGWVRTASTTKCRYRSAASTADNIMPGQSRTFTLKAKTAPGTANRNGTWVVVVSRSNHFDTPSYLKAATAAGSGLTTTAYTFELTTAVISTLPKTPGTACPADNKEAIVGSTKTIIVCGKNRASSAFTPVNAYSTLGGTMIATPGTFGSGSIVKNSGNVVLANWTATTITNVFGTGKKVIAGIGASPGRTSPLRTFIGYSATTNPPDANDDSYSTDEDTTLTVPALTGVLSNDTDADGDPLTAALVDDADNGDLTLNADGSFSYDPDDDFAGTDTFTYKANDTHVDSAAATVTITVNPVNDAPVGNDDAANVGEDSTGATVNVLGNDTDVDGDTLAVSAVDTTGTTGTVTNNGTDVTYDPNGMFEYLGDGQTATDTFTYTVSDGNGGTDTATVTITIIGDNDDPVAVDDTASTDEATSTGPISVLTNDSDAEGAVTITAVNTGGTLGTVTDNNDGTVTYNPNGAFEHLGNGQSQNDTFTYTVTDAQGATDTATVTVTVNGINDAPVGNDDAPSVPEDSTGATVNVLGNDTDAESQTLTVTAVDTTGTTGVVTNNGTDVTYDPNGMFEYLGDGQTAQDVFTYTVTDSQGGTDTATVTVTIIGDNDDPNAVDDAYSTNEATQIGPLTVLVNDTDAEGAVTITSVDTTGTDGSVTNNNDGTVTYNPNGAFEDLATGESENDTFTYTITDAQGATDTATVTVTVNGINDAPVGNDDAANVGEDSTGATVNVLGNDTDAESQTLAVTAVDTTGTTGTVTNNGTDVTYDPNGMFEYLGDGQTATDVFTYTVTDSQGGTDTATVTITVIGDNDDPVAVDDVASTNENTATSPITVLTNDTDAEGAVTVTSVDTTGTTGSVTNNNDGTVTYDPNGAFEDLANGETDTDTFTYTITDAQGATDTATVTVTINGVNDAPVAADDTAGVGEDSSGATVNVLGNDTDAESQTLAVTAIDTTGTSGTVTNNGTDVTYDPNGMFEYLDDTETAQDVFTYTVSDSQGGTDTATVTITVSGANDAPVANDDTYQVVQDTTLTVSAPGVLTNDTDADTEALTAGNASTPADGTLTLNPDGSFEYVPESGFLGAVTFTYDVSDGTATDTATVTLNVVPPNETPVALATSGSGLEDGGPITVTLTGTDGDDDDLTFTAGTATKGLVSVPGTVDCTTTLNTCTTTVTYTPNADTNGSDSFTYTVNDGTIDSAPATASITVTPVNDEPSFTKGADQTVNEDAGAQTVSGWATAISAGPADESGQNVDFVVTTDNDALFSALPTVTDGGQLDYTPAVNANGSATVSVHITDDGGVLNGGDDTSPVQTFTITVNAVNDEPSFTKGADQVLFEDAGAQSVSGWATAISKGPADESAQTLTFTVTNDNNALFSSQPAVSDTGTLTFTSAPDAVGTTTVSVYLSDSGGTANGGDDTSPTQTFTITVNGVNDAPSFTHDGNQTVLEDAGAQTVAGFVNTTSAGPADESAQTVTVSVTGNDNNPLFSAQPAIDASGTLTYTPAADANGSAIVTAHATDDGGTANGGDDTGNDVTFTITVTAVNDEPSFTKGADQTLNEDSGAQSVSGWATSISKGPANESAQTLAFTVTNDNNSLFSAQPAVSPTGTLTFTSGPNQYGSATVSVYVMDNGGTANGGDDTSPTQTFTITVNPVNDAPAAAAKSFTVQANMKISLGGLLTGATDPSDFPVPAGQPAYTPTFTLGTISVGAGCIGCTVSNVNNAAGTFDFDPPAGGTGTFTATYTVVDSGYPAPGATSASQTITFTVNGPVVWFVDEDAATVGTGRLSEPFQNLSSAITAMGTNTNQRIHVEDGNSTGNVVLQTNSWLISDTITQNNFDTVMGITPPAGTIARPSNAGAPQRVLTGSVTLGDNSVARGFNLTPTSGTAGLIGSGADGVTVNTMSITTTNARAVDLLNSSGTFSLTAVNASGANRGISLENVNVSSGSFTITGTGSAGSGGTITGATALGTNAVTSGEGGVYLKNTKNVSLDRMIVTANLASGIYGNEVTTFTLANSTVSNNGTDENLDHDGIRFENLLGTSSITGVEVSGSREDSTKVLNTSGTANLTVSNSTFRDNHATLGANGLYIDTKNTAVMTFTSTSNTFLNNNTSGLAIFSQGTQKMNVTVTGGAYTTNGVGLDLETNGTGGMQFSVTGGTVTGCASCGVPVNVYKGSGATGTGTNATHGTITGMTISNGESQLATGIWVHGEGGGAARVAVTNNNISAIAQRGLDATFGNTLGGSSTLDLTVTGNTFVQNNVASLSSINVDAGTISAPSTDSVTICAHIANNNITNPNANDIRVVNSYPTTVVRLPGYAGGATDTTAVQNFLLAQNTASDASAVNNAGAPGFTGGAACAAP